MKTPPILHESQPPRMFRTLASGFNTVANNISLILLPVLVDLALWLGPKVKLENLLLPQLKQMTDAFAQLNTADLQDAVTLSQKVWQDTLANFNLATVFRTLPIGVPSLISREMIAESPLKNVLQYQVPSAGVAALISLGLIILGFFFGNIYFNSLARATAKPAEKLDFKKLMLQFGQSLVMALIMVVLLLIVSFPLLMVFSVTVMASGQMANFILMLALILVLWMVVPLVFAPHGIYVINQKAFPSMMLSIRMVRSFLPGASMFIVTSALVSELMNYV